jgi:drug/metabolite transporter (DMT)-like permease
VSISDVGLAAVFGLLTALSNGLAVTTQHIASTRERGQGNAFRIALNLARQPLWLLGWLALVGSLVFQALALHFGPLAEVQPLLVSELVIALVLRRYWRHQRLRTLTWRAALATTVFLALFLVMTSPSSGTSRVTSSTWWLSSFVVTILAGVVTVSTSRSSQRIRAAGWGAVTALLWALEAAFIKAMTDSFASYGLWHSFSKWPVYAVIVCGVAGLLSEQVALHVGPLSVSQPFIVILDPVASIALGVAIYHERFRTSIVALVVGAGAFIVMCVGAFIMIETAPDTVEPEPRSA